MQSVQFNSVVYALRVVISIISEEGKTGVYCPLSLVIIPSINKKKLLNFSNILVFFKKKRKEKEYSELCEQIFAHIITCMSLHIHFRMHRVRIKASLVKL